MSILDDEDTLVNDSTTEFYEYIFMKFYKSYSRSGLDKWLVDINKDLIRDKIKEYVYIDNGVNIRKGHSDGSSFRNIVEEDLYKFIIYYILFCNEYIPMVDDIGVNNVGKLIIDDTKYYKPRIINKEAVSYIKDYNIYNIQPNLIINKIDEIIINNSDNLFNFISKDYLFIKKIQNIYLNLLNKELYLYPNKIKELFDKFNNIFGISEIGNIIINLNDLYFACNKDITLFDNNGIDEHIYNILSNIIGLRSDNITIKIDYNFVNDLRFNLKGDVNQTYYYFKYIISSIISKNNIYNKLNLDMSI